MKKLIAIGMSILISIGSVGVVEATDFTQSPYFDPEDPFWKSEVEYGAQPFNPKKEIIDKYGDAESNWGIMRNMEEDIAPRGLLPTQNVKGVEKLTIDVCMPWVSTTKVQTINEQNTDLWVPWESDFVGFPPKGEYIVEVWDESTYAYAMGFDFLMSFSLIPIRKGKQGWGMYDAEEPEIVSGVNYILGDNMDVNKLSLTDIKEGYYLLETATFGGSLYPTVGVSKGSGLYVLQHKIIRVKYTEKPNSVLRPCSQEEIDKILQGIYTSTVLPGSMEIVDLNGEYNTLNPKELNKNK